MLLKVENEYLDFNGDIEIEKQFLLLNDIDSVGDFSYSFQLYPTAKNKSILGITNHRSSSKRFYNDLRCEIQSDGGITIYRGILRIENANKRVIEASFFSGNTDWIIEIEGSCLDLNFNLVGVTEVEKTAANIQASWNETTGLVFPLLDSGLMFDRVISDTTIDPYTYVEDYQGAIYAKNVMDCIFFEKGIKLEGELFEEALYTNLLISSNNIKGTQELLDRRAARASKTSSQNIGTSYTKVTFTDDATYPNYNNGFYSTANSEWTADRPMRITGKAHVLLDASVTSYLLFRRNGAAISGASGVTGVENTTSLSTRGTRDAWYLDVEAGDVITVEFKVSTGTVNVLTGSFVEITPISFRDVVVNGILGTMQKTDFVSSIFRMFGVIPKYNAVSKTLTCNLLKKLKSKTPVEITGTVIDEDYTDIISGYGRNTVFNFNTPDIDEIKKYNAINVNNYGSGVIEIANSYLPERVDIPINFCPGYVYYNEVFAMSLVNFKFREFEEDGDEITISAVAGAAGMARFTTSTAHGFAVDDWVRIIDTDSDEYLGNGKISAVPASTTFEIYGLQLSNTTTNSGTVIKLEVVENETDNVFAFVNVVDADLYPDVSLVHSNIYLNGVAYPNAAFAYTNFPASSIDIDTTHIHTIHFDNVNIPGYNQVGLLQNYYREFASILNDPCLLRVESYINEGDFISLSSQSPMKFYSDDGYGLYYLNRITGYKGSHLPCEVELIKL